MMSIKYIDVARQWLKMMNTSINLLFQSPIPYIYLCSEELDEAMTVGPKNTLQRTMSLEEDRDVVAERERIMNTPYRDLMVCQI